MTAILLQTAQLFYMRCIHIYTKGIRTYVYTSLKSISSVLTQINFK